MENYPIPLLTLLIFTPISGAAILLPINSIKTNIITGIGIISALCTLLLSLYLFFNFSKNSHDIQFSENYSWIPELGSNYFVGIDGISIPFIFLTTFLFLIAHISLWSKQTSGGKELTATLLAIESSALGIFCSMDFFLFFIFWETLPITVGVLIGCWGEGINRMEKSLKFFVYSFSGTFLFLGALLYMYIDNFSRTGLYTLNILDYQNIPLEPSTRFLLFITLFFAIGVRLPIFPLHTWLPEVQKDGSTISNIILSGVYLKVGIYGYLRFLLPLLGDTAFNFVYVISWIAIIGIIYCGLLAFFQETDYETIAYANIAQIGLITLGIFTINIQGIQGALLLTVGHGLASALLIIVIGIRQDSKENLTMKKNKIRRGPTLNTVFFLAIVAFVGFPCTVTFAGELLILIGTFKNRPFYAILASIGSALTLLYMLRLYLRNSPEKASCSMDEPGYNCITTPNRLCLFLLIFMILLLGFYPNLLLSVAEPTVQNLVEQITPKISQ